MKDLLCGQFRLDDSYVDRRITTIFLDGKPVDAIGTARIREGSTLALSAAMPGLAGAILRRGGPMASLRANITCEDGGGEALERESVITVKLFNLVAPELAPGFLRRGVLLPAAEAEAFLHGRPPAFWGGCREILLDGKRVEAALLKGGCWAPHGDMVELSVALREA